MDYDSDSGNSINSDTSSSVCSTDSDSSSVALNVFTCEEMLNKGLECAGYSQKQINNNKCSTKVDWFNDQCGANHIVAAHIWDDLQLPGAGDWCVPPQKINVEHFLMSLCFLKKCPTEKDREAKFNYSHVTVATWTWHYLRKIQALKTVKIVWDEGKEDDIWILSVDGTHCWINEPKHPTLSHDSAYYSHKFERAGVDYELAFSLSTGHLIWMSGPHPAGDSDLKVFALTGGLWEKLKAAGKCGIADRGYVGHLELSTPNAGDEEFVKLFKSRALKRHEHFNGMTKVFQCLDGRFRHSLDKFATCFESVSVICQHKLEHGQPLFDILTPSVV